MAEPIDPAALAESRKCERVDCTFKVPNAVTDLNHILQCMSNHLLAMHPVGQSDTGGGGAAGKSSAAIPILSEDCDEIAYAAWLARFERWQLACRITDKQVENRILEAVPSQVADTIVIGLSGAETKYELLVKIKDVMVKKKSIFLYRSDLHKLTQHRSELPERFAARIRQAAPPCQLHSDSGTADYSQDLLSTIFILGLTDGYTKEKLFQLAPKENKTTVEFNTLVWVASEISQAKENCLESGSSSMMGMSGGDRTKPKSGWSACRCCNTKDHSAKGFSEEVRKESCKAFKSKCKKCGLVGHFTDCCMKGKKWPSRKAKVAAVSVEEATAAAVAPAVLPPAVSTVGATGPAASLSSVAQVSEYHFDPNRYAGDNMENGSWWAFEAVKPISSRRIWAAMEAQTAGPALGHFLFDKINNVWKSASPPGHAAKHVKIEIDRMSYKNQGRSKMNRKSLDTWSFPDSGAQVTLISPKLVRALGGEGLVQQASLQIKGATGHVLKTSGCLFIVITRKDEHTGVFQKTHQQAYISADIDSVVLSREAMESLKLVSDLDDRKRASVSLVSNTLMQPFYSNPVSPVASQMMGKSSSPGGVPVAGASLRASRIESSRLQLEASYVRERHRSLCPTRGRAGVHSTHVKVLPGLELSSAGEAQVKVLPGLELSSAGEAKSEYIEYNDSDRVQGGQVTLDLLAIHNVDFPANKVSLSDLKASKDTEHKCRGSLPLKNGILTCGCYIRKEAPDPISHKDVVGFENMSRDALRRLIIQQYAQSGFNNCRIQPLKMMRGSPLRLFVDK